MGAKQSKRSVDISGKEAESAGEVAAAGAGGEGRVEQLADADALKPQLNGDAHNIQPTGEHTDKEKQLDSGTPENEKDATTEKEGKQESEKEKEVAPITNGESEQKAENGDSSPAPEEGKKPKKEKVKKKWSLRSISFSRKDKPKQEKKQKDDESKTNGEPEKVPEEAAEATPEPMENKMPESKKSETEVKDEKTPETPVTEPLTNGSSTPETPKDETPITEEPVATIVENDRPEPKLVTEPDQLPVNGLSIEESKIEAAEEMQNENSKPEEPTAETTESAPAPEIPVKTEVCVEKMPLIEPTPPPLPANPPPSSVASFAATTMAPELTDASLANTADAAIPPLSVLPDTKNDIINDVESQTTIINTEIDTTDLPPPLKETTEEETVENELKSNTKFIPEILTTATDELLDLERNKTTQNEDKNTIPNEIVTKENLLEVDSSPVVNSMDDIKEINSLDVTNDSKNETIESQPDQTPIINSIDTKNDMKNEIIDSNPDQTETINPVDLTIDIKKETIESHQHQTEMNAEKAIEPIETVTSDPDVREISEPIIDDPVSVEDLPPPPPMDIDDVIEKDIVENVDIKPEITNESIEEMNENTVNVDYESVVIENIGIGEDSSKCQANQELATNETVEKVIECNDNVEKTTIEAVVDHVNSGSEEREIALEECIPAAKLDRSGSDESDCLPPPPSDLCTPEPPATTQEPMSVSDKISELIPEIPAVPEIKTETLQETTNDVAVVN